MMKINLPEYTEDLIQLSRLYDAVTLVKCSSTWFSYAMVEDGYIDEGNKKRYELANEFSEWTLDRLRFMRENLPALRNCVHQKIVEESKPYFKVEMNGNFVELPEQIDGYFSPYLDQECGFSDDGVIEKALAYSQDHHVIVWDTDLWKIPKAINTSFIEIWWRRNWLSENRHDDYYELFLKRNEQYGWDCYGHER